MTIDSDIEHEAAVAKVLAWTGRVQQRLHYQVETRDRECDQAIAGAPMEARQPARTKRGTLEKALVDSFEMMMSGRRTEEAFAKAFEAYGVGLSRLAEELRGSV